MDITLEVIALLATIIYLITTIAMWKKKIFRYLLILVIVTILSVFLSNYFNNTFTVKNRPIFKLNSKINKFNYEKEFINDISKLSRDQIETIMQATIGEFDYHLKKLSAVYDDIKYPPFIVKYPEYFMTEEQKILYIINYFIQERLPYVKFKGVHFSYKTEIGYFLFIAIDFPQGEIPDKYFKVKNKFIQMFISIDDKFIVWNNLINKE